jgi:hypothetical protein
MPNGKWEPFLLAFAIRHLAFDIGVKNPHTLSENLTVVFQGIKHHIKTPYLYGRL